MIPDELESLTLILIYYSVRYLESNIIRETDIANFLEQCFDAFSLGDDRPLCGQQKTRIIVEDGVLNVPVAGVGSVEIKFGDPLDGLISDLLKRFRAYYKVTKYDTARPQESTVTSVPVQYPLSKDGYTLIFDPRKFEDAGLDTTLISSQQATSSKATPDEKPTDEERHFAKNVMGHKWMMGSFFRAILGSGWKMIFKAENDRVPAGWKSTLPLAPASHIRLSQAVLAQTLTNP